MTRNSYYDNSKCILIFLVVLGHLLEPSINESNFTKSIFIFIYIFHMPCFIFTTGYFSKIKNWKETFKDSFKFLTIYLCVQILFIYFTKLIHIVKYNWTIITSYYVYWYIFAMVVWKIMLKLSEKINIKIIFIFSLIIGLAIGLIDNVGTKFSLSRIFVFFPFFILGYYFRINNLNIKNIIKNRYFSFSILIISFIVILLKSRLIRYSWLYCFSSYHDLNVAQFNGILYRCGIYIIQFILLFSVFSLIPSKKEKFTFIGSHTLSIYLIHGFIVKLILVIGFYKNFNLEKEVFIPIIAIALILIIIFSTSIINSLKKLIIFRLGEVMDLLLLTFKSKET